MLIEKTLSLFLIILLLSGNIIAQQIPQSDMEKRVISPQLEKNAVEFLRQTIKEIPNLKSEINRQYFTIETAQLLWKYDEKEARKMFENSMSFVRQWIIKTNQDHEKQLGEIEELRKKLSANSNSASNTSKNDEVEDYWNYRKYGPVLTLRDRLIENLLIKDSDLAYSFLKETSKSLKSKSSKYSYYYATERSFINAMIKKDEIDKAIEATLEFQNDDYSEGFTSIVKEIYKKDTTKGNFLAEEIFRRLKTESGKKTRIYYLSLFFDSALETIKEKQPLLKDSSLKELAKIIGEKVLAEMNGSYYSDLIIYAKKIEKYAPQEAKQILEKAKQKQNKNSNSKVSDAANKAAEAAMMAAMEEANLASKTQKNEESKDNDKAENTDKSVVSEEILYKRLQKDSFTDDERAKLIADAKESILTKELWQYSRGDGYYQIVNELSTLALVSKDKQISEELLKEAEKYVRPQTENYVDYTSKFMLAIGNSSVNPEKSFALLESMDSVNELISSATKLGVFIDSDSTLILDGEIGVSFFLKTPMYTQLYLHNDLLNLLIRNLAQADFKRIIGLSEKFEKQEVKMSAKFLILDSLLGEKNQSEDLPDF